MLQPPGRGRAGGVTFSWFAVLTSMALFSCAYVMTFLFRSGQNGLMSVNTESGTLKSIVEMLKRDGLVVIWVTFLM